jgi:hypothetical protein
MFSSVHASKYTEDLVVQARNDMVANALAAGRDVIVDDTNIAVRHENKLRDVAGLYGAALVVQDFTGVPVEECVTRDAARSDVQRVGEAQIRKMAAQLAKRPSAVPALPYSPYQAPDGVPSCVLFDVDGTLARMTDRKPFEWAKVGQDQPNTPVVDLARTLIAAGETVLVMSGRLGVCRAQTQAWLDAHVSPGLPLFMRSELDRSRPDNRVKFDLFNEHVAGRFNVRFVVDDRNAVVNMWRRVLGLTCLQVAEGNF